jgi:hypothetical protein
MINTSTLRAFYQHLNGGNTMYTVFVRDWWRMEKGTRVPYPGAPKTIIDDDVETREEALELCKEYNDTHDPGPLSRKAEFMSD